MGKLLDTVEKAALFCIKNNLSVFEVETLTLVIMEDILGIDVEFEYKDFRKTIQREYKSVAEEHRCNNCHGVGRVHNEKTIYDCPKCGGNGLFFPKAAQQSVQLTGGSAPAEEQRAEDGRDTVLSTGGSLAASN